MRAMPGLRVIRPADANETAQAWRVHIDGDGPTALILTRQKRAGARGHRRARAPTASPRGAYVLVDEPRRDLDLVLIGTGSEVSAVRRRARRCSRPTGSRVRVVSMPSWELFAAQADDVPRRGAAARRARRSRSRPRRSFGWERYADDVVAIDHFGASAPGRRRARASSATPPRTSPTRPRAARLADPRPHPRTRRGDAHDQRRSPACNDFGQSPWYDNLTRSLLTRRRPRSSSSPTTASAASRRTRRSSRRRSAAGEGYDEQLARARQRGPEHRPTTRTGRSSSTTSATPPTSCARSTTRSAAADGFVSVEVSPDLAHDTAETIDAGRRSCSTRLGRPNVMIKIPATLEGLPAIDGDDRARAST